MDYVFLGKTLPVENVRARSLFTDDRLQLSDVQGALFSGAIKGTADISLARGDPHYHANLAVEGIDFPRLTNLYFNYRTAQGHMSGDYDFTGLGDNARAMRGSGKIRVDNGDVFAIPVFGPLSRTNQPRLFPVAAIASRTMPWRRSASRMASRIPTISR